VTGRVARGGGSVLCCVMRRERPKFDLSSSRLHSKLPEDAAWRKQQAHVDADIEGLARDPQVEQMVAEWKAAGVPVAERIQRLVRYFSKTGAEAPVRR
jgi:hypothetical protein